MRIRCLAALADHFQISSAMLETEAMQRSIELLGSEVAPAVKAALRHEKVSREPISLWLANQR